MHTHVVAVSFAIVYLGARPRKETVHTLLDGKEDMPYGGAYQYQYFFFHILIVLPSIAIL